MGTCEVMAKMSMVVDYCKPWWKAAWEWCVGLWYDVAVYAAGVVDMVAGLWQC